MAFAGMAASAGYTVFFLHIPMHCMAEINVPEMSSRQPSRNMVANGDQGSVQDRR